MTNWILYKDENSINRDEALELLVSSLPNIEEEWSSYLQNEYGQVFISANRLHYLDVAAIGRIVVKRIKNGEEEGLKEFFEAVENIITFGDEESKQLIIVGLLEDLQNISGSEGIDYYTNFNQWLKSETKKEWDFLIYIWESDDSPEIKKQKLKEKNNNFSNNL